VRPKRQARGLRPARHQRQVGLESVEVEDRGGRRDRRAGARLADEVRDRVEVRFHAPMYPGIHASWAARRASRLRLKRPGQATTSPPASPTTRAGTPLASAAASRAEAARVATR